MCSTPITTLFSGRKASAQNWRERHWTTAKAEPGAACLQVKKADTTLEITVQGADAVALVINTESFGLTVVSAPEEP